jgi:diguanylate cyclase (GGDEF)-like protein
MADIDHFKLVNDTYGHPIGDCVLQHVAKILAQSFRKDDIVGRLGGEEFGILLPNVTLADALIQANRVRETLAETPSITTAGEIVVTISIGLAGLNCSDSSECLNRADKALYDAKNTGRNRVCVWRA